MDLVDPTITGDAAAIQALLSGHLQDPFALLGPHDTPHGRVVRVFAPGALAVRVAHGHDEPEPLSLVAAPGYFAGKADVENAYRLHIVWPDAEQDTADPYAFGPLLDERDLALLRDGRHPQLADILGAHAMSVAGVAGVRFAVWAPNAQRAAVVGDFNGWDGRRN